MLCKFKFKIYTTTHSDIPFTTKFRYITYQMAEHNAALSYIDWEHKGSNKSTNKQLNDASFTIIGAWVQNKVSFKAFCECHIWILSHKVWWVSIRTTYRRRRTSQCGQKRAFSFSTQEFPVRANFVRSKQCVRIYWNCICNISYFQMCFFFAYFSNIFMKSIYSSFKLIVF